MTEVIVHKKNYDLVWHKRGGIHTPKGLFITAPKKMVQRIYSKFRRNSTARPNKGAARRPLPYSMESERAVKKPKYIARGPAANVGFPMEKSCKPKCHQLVDQQGALVLRQLGWAGSNFNVTDITNGTMDEENLRTRDVLDYRGFSYELNIVNPLDGVALHCNIAVVSPKHSLIVDNVDWFRGQTNTRGVDFNVSLNSLDISKNAINTDKYNVLSHERYLIAPLNQGAPAQRNNGDANYMHIKKYIKVNRQIRYENNLPTTPIFFLMWYDRFLAAGGTPADTLAANSYQLRLLAYFKDAC
jgi:hypothetical protein